MSVWSPQTAQKEAEKAYLRRIEKITTLFIGKAIEENLKINELKDVINFMAAKLESSYNGKQVKDLIEKNIIN